MLFLFFLGERTEETVDDVKMNKPMGTDGGKAYGS